MMGGGRDHSSPRGAALSEKGGFSGLLWGERIKGGQWGEEEVGIQITLLDYQRNAVVPFIHFPVCILRKTVFFFPN